MPHIVVFASFLLPYMYVSSLPYVYVSSICGYVRHYMYASSTCIFFCFAVPVCILLTLHICTIGMRPSPAVCACIIHVRLCTAVCASILVVRFGRYMHLSLLYVLVYPICVLAGIRRCASISWASCVIYHYCLCVPSSCRTWSFVSSLCA